MVLPVCLSIMPSRTVQLAGSLSPVEFETIGFSKSEFLNVSFEDCEPEALELMRFLVFLEREEAVMIVAIKSRVITVRVTKFLATCLGYEERKCKSTRISCYSNSIFKPAAGLVTRGMSTKVFSLPRWSKDLLPSLNAVDLLGVHFLRISLYLLPLEFRALQ